MASTRCFALYHMLNTLLATKTLTHIDLLGENMNDMIHSIPLSVNHLSYPLKGTFFLNNCLHSYV